MNNLVDVAENALTAEAAAEITALDSEIKAKQERLKEIKESLLEYMKSHEIVKMESEEIAVTFVAPTLRETLNSKQLRQDNPDLYDEYVDITPVKESIRIKVKEVK